MRPVLILNSWHVRVISCQGYYYQSTSVFFYLILAAVGEVEFGLLTAESHARLLGHHLHVNRLTRLNADNKLVPVNLAASENVVGHVTKLNAYFGFAFIQCCTKSDQMHRLKQQWTDAQLQQIGLIIRTTLPPTV